MTETNERFKVATELLNNENPEKALPILEELAADGHIESMILAANCYCRGCGIGQNISLAIMYLQQASNAGSEIAKQLLVLLEKTGTIEADRMWWRYYGA